MSVTTVSLRIADSVADRAGILRRPLRVEDLIARAQRESGSYGFRRNRLHRTVAPFARHLLGARGGPQPDRTARHAMGRGTFPVQFVADSGRGSASARTSHRRRIERPIFITGLPRSGTTFLHRLMMTDPGQSRPAVWETIFPWPQRRRGRTGASPRWRRQLKMFEWLAPEFRALHPLEADVPAGMQRNHRACVPQPALRYELLCAVVPALARRGCDGGICRLISSTAGSCGHLQYQDGTRPANGC